MKFDTIDPQYGINKLIKYLKGLTSSVLRKEFIHLKQKLPTLWTNSYFLATNGGAPIEIMKSYVENQQLSERKKEKNKWMNYIKS